MKPDEVIANLVQSHGGPCVLDRLHVPYDHASSGPAAKFGLGCELFLPNIDRQTLRTEVAEFLVAYQNRFPQIVNQFLPRDQRRTVKIKGDLTNRLHAEYEKFPSETGYSTSLFGAVDIGLPKDDIEPYQAHCIVQRAQYAKLSFISATIPVCDGAGNPNFDTLLQAVLQWCKTCRPVHGSAGFALIFGSGLSQNTRYTLHLMKRFPGFDFVNGINFSGEAESVHNRIKCVNWLTVLCDELVTELGGIEPMRSELEPVCKIHEYEGGILIQAGETPQLGDTYRDDVPQAYRDVARYTKAIRFDGYTDTLFRVPNNLDDVEEARSWVRRFD